MYKKRVFYVIQSAVLGFLYFFLSYHIVFRSWAEEDVFLATIGNLLLIFVILVVERMENYIAIKLSSRVKQKKTHMLSKILDVYLKEASLKSALYCFYIVLLICIALLAANPEFEPLRDMKDYFLSVRYGILVLIAVDKFMDQVFKDLKNQEVGFK